MALFMFWGAEKLEDIVGEIDNKDAPKFRYLGAVGLVVIALATLVIGQPSTEDRWQRISGEKIPLLEKMAYQIHPGELLHTMHDPKINLLMLDVRSEADYNMFHILDAQHILPEEIHGRIDEFHLEPANTVFVVMSNDEGKALDVWKIMVSEAVPNVYILDGGINNWLGIFSGQFEQDFCAGKKEAEYDELRYEFTAALGAGCPAAYPNEEDYDLIFEEKIKLELKRAPTSGGCG
jgi:rhodanese-related sulfurtransferase